jgi:hypothetical protein
VGDRRRKVIEDVVGGLLGFGVGFGLIGLGLKASAAIGADPITFVVVLAMIGGGRFVDGSVQVGIAVVRAVSLHARTRWYLRAGRWEELASVARKLVEDDEWYAGFDHPRTVMRRSALISVLVRLERFDEAHLVADRNVGSLSRALGATHPDTAAARVLAEILRQASRDPSVAESLLQAMRARLEDQTSRIRS